MRKTISVISLFLILVSAAAWCQQLPQAQRAEFEKRFKQGVELANAGNIDGAIAEFSAAHKASPKDIATLQNLGALYMKKNNDKNAESALLKIIYIQPKNTFALENLTRIYIYRKNNAAALRYSQLFLDAAPTKYESRYLCGVAYTMNNYAAKAIDNLRAALHVKPADPDASMLLAEQYIKTEKYTDALGTMKRVLAADPKNAKAALLAGYCASQLEQGDEAISYYKMATANPETKQGAWAGIAKVYQDRGDEKNAKEALRKGNLTADGSPSTGDETAYQKNMVAGQQAINGGKWDEAKKYADAARKAKPGDRNALMMYAYCCINTDDAASAVKIIDEALAAEPGNLQALELKAMIQSRSGDGKGLVGTYNNWIKYHPADFTPHLRLAGYYSFQNDKANAEKHFAEAAKLAPDNTDVLSAYGSFKGRFGDFAGAYELYAKCIALSPGNPAFVIPGAEALKSQGKNNEAEQLYLDNIKVAKNEDNDRTLRLSLVSFYREIYQHRKVPEHMELLYKRYPNDPDIVAGLEGAYDDLNMYEKAINISRKLIELKPDVNEYKLHPAFFYERWGKDNEAIAEAKAVADADPDFIRAGVWLAEKYAKMGKYDEAIDRYNKLIANPGEADVSRFHAAIGDIKMKQGDKAAATEAYGKALGSNPANAAALNAMAAYYDGEKKPDEFLTYQEDLIKKSGDKAPTNYYYRYCVKNNQRDRARTFLENLYKTDKRTVVARALAACYKDDKNVDGAIGIYEDIIKNNPKDANVRRLLINLYVEKGDYAAAVPHYEVFSKQMATEKKLRSGYAEALEKVGRKDDAVKQYELLMKEDPGSAAEIKEKIKALKGE